MMTQGTAVQVQWVPDLQAAVTAKTTVAEVKVEELGIGKKKGKGKKRNRGEKISFTAGNFDETIGTPLHTQYLVVNEIGTKYGVWWEVMIFGREMNTMR
jgi:hypothetical protein